MNFKIIWCPACSLRHYVESTHGYFHTPDGGICHFTLTGNFIQYHADSTHYLGEQSFPLLKFGHP